MPTGLAPLKGLGFRASHFSSSSSRSLLYTIILPKCMLTSHLLDLACSVEIRWQVQLCNSELFERKHVQICFISHSSGFSETLGHTPMPSLIERDTVRM